MNDGTAMNEIDPEILQLAREEAAERVENIEKNLLAVESGSIDPEVLNELFRDAHSIESAAAMLDWKRVAAIAQGMEDRFSECREGRASLTDVIDETLATLDQLRLAIASDEAKEADPEGATEIATPEAPPVAARAQQNGAPAAEAPQNGGPEAAEERPIPAQNTPQNGDAAAAAVAEPIPVAADKPIRVSAAKVDRILDAVGETALNHRRLEHVLRERLVTSGNAESEQELDMGHRMLGELHDSVIGMRTLPLSSITAPFPRAIRDIAVAEGKEVELLMSGTDTQLDRSILEGLAEQINHVLRNAVAHGIEAPDEREAAGKPREGMVELRAEQRGGMVAIEIGDDGGGVPAEVLARAEGDGALTDLLSAPGFSTADGVSGIAGRGVGLDAVRKHVETRGGSLAVESEPRQGTTVTLLLPFTLAVMRVLMCERGGQAFGLPLTSVREVVSASGTVSLAGRKSLELDGEAVPFEDLAMALGASAPELPKQHPAMVVGAAGRWRAMACDTVLGDQEVVVKGLGPLLAGTRGYLGGAILGDGSVALILDPNQLARGAEGGSVPPAAATGVKAVAAEVPVAGSRILVVDDQVTARQLQRSILESAGYRVQTACDGREALDRIAENGIDMVMTDVEMPVMDGFELLRAIRGDAGRSSLPVVMVTGLGSDEQRQRGADEGADAYIVKKEYDQQTLLEVVSRLIGD